MEEHSKNGLPYKNQQREERSLVGEKAYSAVQAIDDLVVTARLERRDSVVELQQTEQQIDLKEEELRLLKEQREQIREAIAERDIRLEELREMAVKIGSFATKKTVAFETTSPEQVSLTEPVAPMTDSIPVVQPGRNLRPDYLRVVEQTAVAYGNEEDVDMQPELVMPAGVEYPEREQEAGNAYLDFDNLNDILEKAIQQPVQQRSRFLRRQ